MIKRWTPSIHMPRWASRITLEITDVRVERLQDISEEDCMAEGIQCCPTEGRFKCSPSGGYWMPWRSKFARLWDSIYGTWGTNPWVWVIEFKPHMKNVDEFLKG